MASAFWLAMVTAAAQVGAAAMLGVLRLSGPLDDDAWLARLTLLGWFAISATVAGTFAGARGAGSGTRLCAAFAAGLGGGLGAALALYPIRTLNLNHGNAFLMAGIGLGCAAIAGFGLAFGLSTARVLGWNAAVFGVLVWGLLAAAVAAHPAEIRLGQLDAGLPASFAHSFSLWGLPAIAAVLSLVTAIVARARGHHRAAIAFSGLAGPATIALAYAIAGPGTGDTQKIPWTSALAAVAAGLAASLVVALPSRGTPNEADTYEPVFGDTGTAFPLPPAKSLSDTLSDTLADGPRRRPFADLDDRSAAR